MTVNIEIHQKDNENAMGVLRRFRSRMKSSGIIQRARGLRYHSRTPSKFTQKKSKLTVLDRKERIQKLIKLGKLGD